MERSPASIATIFLSLLSRSAGYRVCDMFTIGEQQVVSYANQRIPCCVSRSHQANRLSIFPTHHMNHIFFIAHVTPFASKGLACVETYGYSKRSISPTHRPARFVSRASVDPSFIVPPASVSSLVLHLPRKASRHLLTTHHG
jgi:hypothetical protein